jgi:hypothetical protein
VLAYQDASARIHFRPTPETGRLAEGFRILQARFLRLEITPADPVVKLAMALALLEAILSPRELIKAIVASSQAYRHENHLVIEWTRDDMRRDRRYLSPITALCIESLAGIAVTEANARDAIAAAAALVFPKSATSVDELFRAAVSWAYESLPGALLGHVTGLAPFAAVSRSTLARQATGLALAAPHTPDGHEDIADQVAGEAMDAFFQLRPHGGSAWLIAKLEEACTHDRNVAPYLNKRSMLLECQLLARRLDEADSMSALLVGWAADLVESGTRAEENLHPGTIHKYVRHIAMPLHTRVNGEEILEWKAEEFQECYSSIIGSAKPGNQGNTASALASWHAFLVRWLDVPMLRKRLHEDVAEPLPAANVIWPHERQRIHEWLAMAAGDERLLGQVSVATRIAGGGRIRARELFHTRLHNVRFYPNVVEVEVAPMIRDGKTKSPSGRRVLVYQDPDTQAVLRAWHARRIAEGALSTDFLFGDPHRPAKIYRLGSFYSMLNRLSKAATGDRTVSLHTWGHAWISTAVETALLNVPAPDVDPLDVIATQAGHLSGITSIRHYSHHFERPLRHHIDQCLQAIPLSSGHAAFWSGVSRVALRQRSFSRQMPAQITYWDAIMGRALDKNVPHAETGISCHSPASPLAPNDQRMVTIDDVILATCDTAAGMDKATVALRSRQGEEWVGKLHNAMLAVLLRVTHLPRRSSGQLHAVRDAIVMAIHDAHRGFDFTRIDQPKYSPIRVALRRMPKDRARELAFAWADCYSGPYISLIDPHAAGRLFDKLANIGVQRDRLALSIATSAGSSPDGAALAHESILQLAFLKAYQTHALVEYKLPRRGRPARYLIWSSSALDEHKTPAVAALSISGYNSLMFALTVYFELNNQEDGSIG